MSTAEECRQFCGLFEAELLLELMLCHWQHPLAGDEEFRSSLIESATAVLDASIRGERLMQDLEPAEVNFVAAVYYAELMTVNNPMAPAEEQAGRQQWLATIHRSLPSCFVAPDRLG